MLNNRSNNIYMCAYHMCIPDVYMCYIYRYHMCIIDAPQ